MSKYWGVKLSWLNENMSIVNWVQKSSTSTLCVVAERRGSHHLIWWKNHTKLTIMIFFIFLYFLTIKGSWKKFFMQNIGITSRVLWSFGIGIFGLLFDDKKKKKNQCRKTCIFLLLIPKNSFGFLVVVMERYALKIAQNLTLYSWFRPSVQKRNDAA